MLLVDLCRCQLVLRPQRVAPGAMLLLVVASVLAPLRLAVPCVLRADLVAVAAAL